MEQVAREEDEITARGWSALASGSPQRLQSIVAPDWVFVIIAKVVVRGKEDSEIIIGHREGKGMTGWGRKKNKWICSKRGFFNRFLELRLLEWRLEVLHL